MKKAMQFLGQTGTFFRQVRQEVSKITWPTKKEAMQGSIIVIVMSLVISVFLLIVDSVFANAVRWILGG